MTYSSELFRLLPSVDELVRGEGVTPLVAAYGRAAVVEACRLSLERLRRSIPGKKRGRRTAPSGSGASRYTRRRTEGQLAILSAPGHQRRWSYFAH